MKLVTFLTHLVIKITILLALLISLDIFDVIAVEPSIRAWGYGYAPYLFGFIAFVNFLGLAYMRPREKKPKKAKDADDVSTAEADDDARSTTQSALGTHE